MENLKLKETELINAEKSSSCSYRLTKWNCKLGKFHFTLYM